jgi:hypothetical protein
LLGTGGAVEDGDDLLVDCSTGGEAATEGVLEEEEE